MPNKTGFGSGAYQLSLVCVEFEAIGGQPRRYAVPAERQQTANRCDYSVNTSVCRRQTKVKIYRAGTLGNTRSGKNFPLSILLANSLAVFEKMYEPTAQNNV